MASTYFIDVVVLRARMIRIVAPLLCSSREGMKIRTRYDPERSDGCLSETARGVDTESRTEFS